MSRSRRTVTGVALVVALGLLLLSIAPLALAGSHVQWDSHGKQVIPTTAAKYTQQNCVSGNGAIVVWREGASPNGRVWATRLWDTGAVAWTQQVASAGTAEQDNPQICSDGSSGAYVVWEDDRGLAKDIYTPSTSARPAQGYGAAIAASRSATLPASSGCRAFSRLLTAASSRGMIASRVWAYLTPRR